MSEIITLTEQLKQHEAHLLFESTCHDSLVGLDKELPSDTHLVRYVNNAGEECFSAIRAFKMSDIFDALHDWGFQVLEIRQGYGRIKPKLYGYKPPGK